jgi:hypothetical protein
MKHALVLCVALTATITIAAQRPIRVYVAQVEAPSGFTDPDHKRRVDSRLDLLKNLRDDKTLDVIETADGADLTLDVLASSHAATGAVTTDTSAKAPILGRGSYSTSTAETAPTVIVKLTAGAYQHEIRGMVKSIRWRDAAYDAGRQIKKWIKDNKQQLLAPKP